MLYAGGTLGQLWKQTDRWHAIITTLRRRYVGKLWLDGADTCAARGPGNAVLGFSYLFSDVDGILPNAADLMATVGRVPLCPSLGESAHSAGRPSPLDADALTDRLRRDLDKLEPFQVQSNLRTALVFTDLYTCNLEGVSYGGPTVCGSNAARNDQEIVDAFEAFMRTVGQRPNVALFLWTVSLAPDPVAARSDPLQHPALLAAITNWWAR